MKIHAYNPEAHIDLSGSVATTAHYIAKTSTSLGSNTPLIESGSGAPGSGPQAAAWDHVHPEFGGAGGSSFGSNSTRVSSTPAAGASSSNSRADHVHDGIGTITASSSNSLNRGTVNLRSGAGIAFGLTNTDGGSGLDTVTIQSIGPPTTRVAIIFVMDGGGATITTGSKGVIKVPFACTITESELESDASSNTTLTIKKRAYGGGAASSIVAAALPTLSGVTENKDATLTGWTLTIAAGDKLYWEVTTNSAAKTITSTLTATRT